MSLRASRRALGKSHPAILRARLDALTDETPPRRLLVAPAPPQATISEEAFQDLIVDLARRFGWLVYHPYDSRHSTPGYPDLTLVRCVGSRVLVMAELKTEKGRLSREQGEWATALLAAGVRYFLWRPSDWGEILATLTAEERTGRGPGARGGGGNDDDSADARRDSGATCPGGGLRL